MLHLALGSPVDVVAKHCTKCGAQTPDQFSGNRLKADGLDSHCRECIRSRIRAKKVRHVAMGKCLECGTFIGSNVPYKRCRRCLDSNGSTKRGRELRLAVLRAYGGETPGCACCGEAGLAFLTLDHLNNGGRAHRRGNGNQGVFRELRRAAFPCGFQILCFNCNVARALYGFCPHRNNDRDAPFSEASSVPTATLEPLRRCTKCGLELAHSSFYADRGTRELKVFALARIAWF